MRLSYVCLGDTSRGILEGYFERCALITLVFKPVYMVLLAITILYCTVNCVLEGPTQVPDLLDKPIAKIKTHRIMVLNLNPGDRIGSPTCDHYTSYHHNFMRLTSVTPNNTHTASMYVRHPH